MLKTIFSIASVLLFCGTTLTEIIHVPGDQPTIQAGIDSASIGDTVLVDTGRYVENINFNGKNIVVGSLFLINQDTSYISQTVIDGNTSGIVVRFANGEDSRALLSGFTITNGVASYGGGVYCQHSSPRLESLKIIRNTGSDGGGISCYDNSSPNLVNMIVGGNYADVGGGINCQHYSNPNLVNVIISGNMVTYYGGGFACEINSSPNLVNVTISGNIANNWGGGICCSDYSSPSLLNTILWDDSPQEISFADCGNPNSITIAYCDVQGGQDSIMTNDNGIVNWLDGNIDSDPLFVDTASEDFHLQEGSPCINAGTAFFEWEGDTLVNMTPDQYYGSAPDMGAFEYGFEGIEDISSGIPKTFTLSQNYPNPFNPTTTFQFRLPIPSYVTLKVYNLLGQEVVTLVDEHKSAGYHQVNWDVPQSGIGSGVYFYRIQAGEFMKVKKCLLVK